MSTRTMEFSVGDAVPAGPAVAAVAAPAMRRRITPGAGKALELLAHALEYLSDECTIRDSRGPSLNVDLEAIEILKALNRRIYMECPQVPSAQARCRAFLRRCLG